MKKVMQDQKLWVKLICKNTWASMDRRFLRTTKLIQPVGHQFDSLECELENLFTFILGLLRDKRATMLWGYGQHKIHLEQFQN